MNCIHCGGNAGSVVAVIGNAHYLCHERMKLGLPTPSLGTKCETCNGAGRTGKGGVFLPFDLGPATIKKSIEAQFPKCPACSGKGYTKS